MKNIASSLVLLVVVLVVASSCFYSETSGESATLKLVITKDSRTTYDCYAVNVVGPGIKSFDSRYPVPPNDVIANKDNYCHYPGISSKLVALQNNEANIEVAVPIGRPRLVQVIGMNFTSGSTQCPAGTFSEIWRDKIDSELNVPEINNDAIFEIGKEVVDLRAGTREVQLEISPLTSAQLNQFGKNYCDPPASASNGTLAFKSFTTSFFATRHLSKYVSPAGGGPYTFTIAEQGGGSSVQVSDLNSFGQTQTDFDVTVLENATGKSASGTIYLKGFKPGSPAVQDPFLWLWMTPDKLDLTQTTPAWNAHFAKFSALFSNNITFKTMWEMLTTGTPENYPSIRTKPNSPNSAYVAKNFLPSNSESWNNSMLFLIFRPTPTASSEILCLTTDQIVPCTSGSSTTSSFFKISVDAGKVYLSACSNCSAMGGSTANAEETVANSFYALGVRFNGVKMTYSLSKMGQATTAETHEKTLSGSFNFNNATQARVSLSASDNYGNTDYSELLIYRQSDGTTFTPLIPCQYLNAKYRSNMDCDELGKQ